ncbi:porin [Cupriavidus consociatus]|uniref:porin n=1 Tax=Cupriavidus consociatus TaxID=2821357 RepID=UPI001AE6008F|nr:MULTISPECIES: porin [unclassified Cupriavidus]MBP0619332.1 porin [Cupriavidus sp. LEh25]MDK2655980.1 porin [Cupriavidus sp. LEh21]
MNRTQCAVLMWLACTGAAHAQSSVTLYGVADIGIEFVNNRPTAQGGSASQFRMQPGNQSGSRFGLRGIEDLGGGLKALFLLENGTNLDTGTLANGTGATSRLFGRSAYVGVQHAWGTLTLGRQDAPIYDFAKVYDPSGVSARYSITSMDPVFSQRIDNSAKYLGKFGGLLVEATYSTGWDAGLGGEIPGAARAGRQMGGQLGYSFGSTSVAVAYDQTQGSSAAAQGLANKNLAVGAVSTFGPIKAYAGYRWNRLQYANGSTALPESTRSDMYWLGASYSLTKSLQLTGSAYYTNNHDNNQDPWLFIATLDYALSKRTDVYLTSAYAMNRNGSDLAVGSGNTVVAGRSQVGALVGMRHKF